MSGREQAKSAKLADPTILKGVAARGIPNGDYSSPGLHVILPDDAFPNMVVGDRASNQWPFLRREVGHNWYVDRRNPTVGFLSRDEALILYNLARGFEGRPCLEIGCWRGWSTVHLALGAGNLEVVDPILADPDFRCDVKETLRRAGVVDRVILHDGSSPEEVERISKATGKRWSLVFIDGDHEADAPRVDAEIVHRYAANDAMVVLHDLASPDVAAALTWLRAQGWNTHIYQTMQIMGVAVRGSVKPIAHIPDPTQRWSLPFHLSSFPVIGETRGARLRRVVSGFNVGVSVAAAHNSASTLDSLPEEDAAALDALLMRAEFASQQDDLAGPFDQLQRKHVDLQQRFAELASIRDSSDLELKEARRAAETAVAEHRNAMQELQALTGLSDQLQSKHVDLLRRFAELASIRDSLDLELKEARRAAETAVAERRDARLATTSDRAHAIRSIAFWMARKRNLFGLTRRLLLGRRQEVDGIIEQMLRSYDVPDHLIHSAMWLAQPRVVFGLTRRRLLTDMRCVEGHVVLALERMLGAAPASVSQPLPELQRLRGELAAAQRRFSALEAAKLDDERALLEADLTIARLRRGVTC